MTAVTAQALKRLVPKARANLVAAVVDNWSDADAAGINTPARIRHFFARIFVETGGLTSVNENLNYTTFAALHGAWPRRFPTPASAKPYIRNPRQLANFVYANRMGNGAPESGDGFAYRGGGMLQTTGRAGYRSMGFEGNPDALREPATAFKTAVREWAKRGCNKMADRNDVVAICRAINGGTNGLAEQRAWLKKLSQVFPDAVAVLGIADDPPAAPAARVTSPTTPTVDGKAVAFVQERLRALGYFEVGVADSDLGTRAQGAITAFRIEHAMPIADADQMPLGIDSELLARLATAEPRKVSVARATASLQTIRNGDPASGLPPSPLLKQTFRMRVAAWFGGIFGTAATTFKAVGDKVPEVKDHTSWVLDLFGSIPPWAYGIGVVALCLFVYGGAKAVETARTQQHRDGEVT